MLVCYIFDLPSANGKNFAFAIGKETANVYQLTTIFYENSAKNEENSFFGFHPPFLRDTTIWSKKSIFFNIPSCKSSGRISGVSIYVIIWIPQISANAKKKTTRASNGIMGIKDDGIHLDVLFVWLVSIPEVLVLWGTLSPAMSVEVKVSAKSLMTNSTVL